MENSSTLTYQQQHRRVPKARGKASNYRCVCGKPAREWSYQHHLECPDEMTENGRPYCPHVDHYSSRCRSCHINYDMTDEKRANVAAGNVGRHAVSDDTRVRLSESHMGQVPWNLGVPATDTSREKMRAAKIGTTETDEHKAAISATLQGRSEEAKEAWRAEISTTLKNRSQDEKDAWRAAVSAALKGKPRPYAKRSGHTRYHTNLGIVKPGCIYCDELTS